MTTNAQKVDNTLLALRQEFDNSFAYESRTAAEQLQSLLVIRINGDPYAIRVSEIGGLHAGRYITPLPTLVSHLLGVAGFRGQIVPVYDLASLCGYACANIHRWIVLLRSHELVALAFESFETHISIAPQSIVATEALGSRVPGFNISHLMTSAVHHSGIVMPIIELKPLLADILRRGELPTQKRSIS